MKYFYYATDTGKLKQFVEYPYELEEIVGVIPAGGLNEKNLTTHKVDLSTLELVELPPQVVYAKASQIKQYYNLLDTSPIVVFGLSLDCTAASQLRMEDAIATFDIQDMYPGEFELLNGVKVIYWTYADNVRRPITKQQLIDMHDEMINQRAIRRARLFRVYNDLKVRSNVTYAELYDETTWF